MGGHRFFFYSREGLEPPHIHVKTAEKAAKFWLSPVGLARSSGYNQAELGFLLRAVLRHQGLFLEAWHDHLG